MKELLLQYAEYNVWANKLIIDAMAQLNDSHVDQEVTSSFPSIRATLLHIMGAESVWLQRLQLVEHPVWLPATFQGTFEEGCKAWAGFSADLVKFVSSQSGDRSFEHVCLYNDNRGNPHKTPVGQILQHVFNHSTYHRGQLVTMMRQVGVTKIPGTDFIGFVRNRS